MDIKKPLTVVSLLGLAALAACGGGSTSGSGPSSSPRIDTSNLGNTGKAQDPNAKGPVTIAGAVKGGTVTVLTNFHLTTTMDPTESYTTDTSTVLSGLMTRSLTQYKYDPATKASMLVPDIATDLGTHNADYTQWKFTIRDGVKWQDGSPVTAQQVAFGIDRSFDRKTFPTGASYSNDYFLGGDTYDGPYSDPNGKDQAVTVDGNTITIQMRKPFPDMSYWASFPAIGAIPTDKTISDPAKYAQAPWSDGPYMIKSFTPGKEMVLVRNPNWDPSTDPGRTQYPDGYDFKMGQDPEKMDQIILADSGGGQTSMTMDDLLAPDYAKLNQNNPSQLTVGPTPCTYLWAPDNRKITDVNVRRALGYAYPYQDAMVAGGDIPGVTAIPATSLMPPGTPGRADYEPLGVPGGTTDRAKAKALLEKANAIGYPIKFMYREDSAISKSVKDVVVKALSAAGFKPEPIAETTNAYYKLSQEPDGPENVRTSFGWCSDWPSGSSWFPVVLQSTDIAKNGLEANLSAFSSPELDAKITDIEKMPMAQQPTAWGNLDKEVFTQDYPLIVTFYTGIAMGHGSAIQGDYDDIVQGEPTWKNVWIKQQ